MLPAGAPEPLRTVLPSAPVVPALPVAPVAAGRAGRPGRSDQAHRRRPDPGRLRAGDRPVRGADVEVAVGAAGGRAGAAQQRRPAAATTATGAAGAPVAAAEEGVDARRDQRRERGAGRVELLDLERGAGAAADEDEIARLGVDSRFRAEGCSHVKSPIELAPVSTGHPA